MCVPGKSGTREALNVGRRESSRADPIVVNALPRKPSRAKHMQSVPQTDTGRRGEKPKVLEITLVKELGKLAP